MSQIAVITDDAALLDQIRARRLQSVKVSLGDLEGFARSTDAPRVVVVDLRTSGQVPPVVATFCRQHPTARVALVVRVLEPTLMLDAMRAGASECIPEPITPQVLDDAFRRLLSHEDTDRSGQLIALVGAKGGVGTTTIAVNMAASLVKPTKGEVLLIDLNIGLGDASVLLGSEPRFSVVDALENAHKVDASFFQGIVDKTPSRVHLLGAGADGVRATVDERRLRAVLDAAARSYRVTIVDCPRFDAGVLNTLDMAARLVVVTTHELASLRHAGQLADRLRQRYGSSRVSVVLNRTDRHSTISDEDVERVTGDAVAHRLPSDYRTAIDALNNGSPFGIDAQNRLAAGCRTLALDLAGLTKDRPAAQSSALTRFVLRRT